MGTGNTAICRNLERVLNTEIAIGAPQKQQSMLTAFKHLPREIDAAVLATPQFQFSPVGMKLTKIQNYLDLVKEQDRTREAIALLESATSNPSNFSELTKSFDKISQLVSELDEGQSNFALKLTNRHGTLEKLEKTS